MWVSPSTITDFAPSHKFHIYRAVAKLLSNFKREHVFLSRAEEEYAACETNPH